jgi:AraC family transcriptional regulator
MATPAPNPLDTPMKEFTVDRLLDSGTVVVRHVNCSGTCRHRSAQECASHTHFVFPYRGVYLRHVGGEQAVADANHVLFFNEGQGYQVSHPVTGGDASLVVSVSEPTLCEPSPP